MYKWIFLAFLPILVVAGASGLKNRRHLPKASFALGFLAFFLHMHLYVAPYAWMGWPGTAKGFEISILDAIALAMIVATKPVRTPVTLKVGFGIYLVALLVATASAMQPVASLFYIWQILRVGLIYIAVSRATAANGETAVGLAAGIGAAVVIQAVSSANQSLNGVIQASGMMGHQNLLGYLSNIAVMPAFAMLLAGRHNKFASLVIIAGAIVAVTGASRATLAMFGSGLLLTTVLSLWHRHTPRKITFAVISAFALAAAVPAMMWAIDRRSEETLNSSNDQRAAMIRATKMMVADHPLGVGPNQYVIVANDRGYSERAGVVWSFFIRSQPVHSGYYLVLAESGYIGLAGILFIFGSFLVIGFRKLKFAGLHDRSEVFVGFYAATIVALGHAYFEWISIAYASEAVLVMAVAAVVGRTVANRKRSAPVREPLIDAEAIAPSPAAGGTPWAFDCSTEGPTERLAAAESPTGPRHWLG